MSRKDCFDVYVGSKTGTFTGVKIRKHDHVRKITQDLASITKDDQITTVSWGDDNQQEILVACGVEKVRSIKVYDTDCCMYTTSFICDCGKGKIVGISRYDEAIMTAVESGEVKLWRYNEEEGFMIKAGTKLERMRQSRINKKLIATGGLENELRLFDVNRQQQIFIAKNVPHDSLQMRLPVWISDIEFLPSTEHIATVSRFGHVRLYDPIAQRRPVVNLETKKEAFTTLSITPHKRQIIVGTAKGKMNLVDLRNPSKFLNTYKGFTGAVTGIACSQTGPYVVSTSLDRYLRIHHIQTKELLRSIYFTSKLSCLLLRPEFSLATENEIGDESVERFNDSSSVRSYSSPSTSDSEASDKEYDRLFETMQVIGNKENNSTSAEEQKKSACNEPVKRVAEGKKSVSKKMKRVHHG